MTLSENDAMKKAAADKAADEYIKDGMTVGLGTGSTAFFAIKRIGERVADERLTLTCVSTSEKSAQLGRSCGLNIVPFEGTGAIDVTIDGADEIDPQLQLIKGLGGALLREKIIAAATETEVIIADGSKLVDMLGTTSPLPVEVIRFGYERTKYALEKQGCVATLRTKDGEIFITDEGNYIYDCMFNTIDRPFFLESRLNIIPGVIDNGLFLNTASVALIARGPDDVETLRRS
ncbi:MAG: ribose-5-phosphate isomerase RpiA [Candidatus Methanomethylophilaceae archaeon]